MQTAAASALPLPSIGPVLRDLLGRHGPALLEQTGRLKSFLSDECPGARREISVLMLALEEGVPQDLMRVQSGEPLQSLGPRLSQRLSDQKLIARSASDWAVRTWARGLGVLPGEAGDDALPATSVELDTTRDRTDSNAPARRAANASDLDAPARAGDVAAIGDAAGATETTIDAPTAVAPRSLLQRYGAYGLGALLLAGAAVWYGTVQLAFGISGAATDGAFVGDGRKHAVQVEFRDGRSAAQSIEVHFVSGASAPTPATWSVPLTPEAKAAGRVEVGSLAYRTSEPASMVYSYTLVGTDGRRSEPFERRFDIQPAAALPAQITRVDVPAKVYAGRAFSVTIAYAPGSGEVARIERKLLDGASVGSAAEQSQPVAAGSSAKAAGSVAYRFEAPRAPGPASVEFTLVDAAGVRSEPQRASFEILPAQAVNAGERSGVIVALREVTTTEKPTGLGAVIGGVVGAVLGHQIGGGHGRTLATIGGAAGGAYAGHQIEGNLATRRYEITVRLDNGGGTHVYTETGAPGRHVGDTVRIVNGSLVRS